MNNIVHCWKDNRQYAEERYGYNSNEWLEACENPSTCLLLDGHKGPHVFTPDSVIRVHFKTDEELEDRSEKS